MGKTISSRGDSTATLEHMQEIVQLVHETMGKDEEPAGDMDQVLEQLDDAVVDMSVGYAEMAIMIDLMSADIMKLMVDNTLMAAQVRRAGQMLTLFTNPVNDDVLVSKALDVLRRDGDPEVVMEADPVNPMLINVGLTFDEQKLAEGLRTAIETYNNDLLDSMIA